MERNVLKEVQEWAEKGYFVSYDIINQYENGRGHLIERGREVPITYTVLVEGQESYDVYCHEAGFENIYESLEWGLDYLNKNIK